MDVRPALLRKVRDRLAAIHHAEAERIGVRFRHLRVRAVEHSGSGAFVDLDVDRDAARVHPVLLSYMSGPGMVCRYSDASLGSVLFPREGFFEVLEVFAYGMAWPGELRHLEVLSSTDVLRR